MNQTKKYELEQIHESNKKIELEQIYESNQNMN